MRKIILLLFLLGTSICFAQERSKPDTLWKSEYQRQIYYHFDNNCPMLVNYKNLITVEQVSSPNLIKRTQKFYSPCHVCVEHKEGSFIYNKFGVQKKEKTRVTPIAQISENVSPRAFSQVASPNADIYAVKNAALKVSSRANLQVGSYYPLLQVARAQDMKLAGADIICQILERRKSNLTGTEGVLRFRPICIRLTDGTEIQLVHDDIFLRGRNRSNVKLWLFPFFPVAGEGAKLNPDQEIPLYFK